MARERERGEASFRIELDPYSEGSGFIVIKSRAVPGAIRPREGTAHRRTLWGAKRLVRREKRKESRRLKRVAKNKEQLFRGL